MSKVKTAFFCQNCGYESTKWVGKCPSCAEWNTFTEEIIQKENVKSSIDWKDHAESNAGKTLQLSQITSSEEKRIVTADAELNRVLGGGIVPGSIVLIAHVIPKYPANDSTAGCAYYHTLITVACFSHCFTTTGHYHDRCR